MAKIGNRTIDVELNEEESLALTAYLRWTLANDVYTPETNTKVRHHAALSGIVGIGKITPVAEELQRIIAGEMFFWDDDNGENI